MSIAVALKQLPGAVLDNVKLSHIAADRETR